MIDYKWIPGADAIMAVVTRATTGDHELCVGVWDAETATIQVSQRRTADYAQRRPVAPDVHAVRRHLVTAGA